MLSTAQEYKTRAASKSIAGGGRSKKQASDAASFRPYAGASRPRRRSTLVVVDSGQPRRRITLRAHQNPGAVRCTSGSSPRRHQHFGGCNAMSAKDLVVGGSDTDCFHHLQELSSFAGSSAKDSKRCSRFWIRYYSKRFKGFRFSFFFYQSFPFLQSIPFLLTISIRGKKKKDNRPALHTNQTIYFDY